MENLTNEQNTLANQAQTENIVKRVLTSEVKYLIGVVLFLVGVVAPYYQIKQDIELIKQNHFFHIEVMQKDILKLQEHSDYNREIIVKLMQVISENK